MQVVLQAKTESVLGVKGENLVAYFARVSNPTNQETGGGEARLARYLIRHKHWSPFEMVHVVMKIVTTRDIARQILRHRSFSFQEFSQRYAAVGDGYELRETRMQDFQNRQNSLESNDPELDNWWQSQQEKLNSASRKLYKQAIQKGIAKEIARAVLPEGITETTLFMSGNLRSWIHYVELRTGSETQKEHRRIATACGEILMAEYPWLWADED